MSRDWGPSILGSKSWSGLGPVNWYLPQAKEVIAVLLIMIVLLMMIVLLIMIILLMIIGLLKTNIRGPCWWIHWRDWVPDCDWLSVTPHTTSSLGLVVINTTQSRRTSEVRHLLRWCLVVTVVVVVVVVVSVVSLLVIVVVLVSGVVVVVVVVVV